MKYILREMKGFKPFKSINILLMSAITEPCFYKKMSTSCL